MKFDIQVLKPIFLSLILLCVVVYAFFNYMYKPMRDRDLELDTQIAKKEEEKRQTEKIVANLDIKKAEFEKVKQELEYVITRLPSKEEIPELIKTITDLAIKSNIELITFLPQESIRKEVYEEIPIRLTIKGTYHNVGQFLANIGNLERIITPSNVMMTALSPTIKDPATANANLLITAFVYKEH